MAFTPGTYEGIGRGYRGKLPVSVTVSEDKIESVVVGKHKEVRGIAWGLNTTPIELYPQWIVEYQSLNIPSILGADTTCAALMQAVVAALKAAGATDEDIAALKAKDGPKLPEYVDEEITVDVLVAGGGAGGLAAAIEAHLGGAKVLLVEKQGVTGGSTARSGGKLLACDSKAQKKQGIFDNASRVSSYNSKNIKDKDGNSLLAEYAISDDEKDVYLQGLTSVLPEIYEKILKITNGVEDAYMFETTDTDVKFTIQDNDAYNKNVLSLVDASLLECIIEGSLKAWYKNCAQADLLQLYVRSFNDNLEKLFNRMFQLKIKKTTSMLGEQL